MEIAASAADFPTDKFLDFALKQAVFALKPYWLPALRAGRLNFENKAARVSMLVRADGTSDVVQSLRALLQSPQTSTDTRESYWRILADVGDANDLAAMLNVGDTGLQARLLPVIHDVSRSRNLRPSGNLVAALQPMILGDSDTLRAGALRLVGLWKLDPFRGDAQVLALNLQANENVRRAAVEALGGFDDGSTMLLLARLAAAEPSTRVRASAITALIASDLNVAARSAAAFLSRAEDNATTEELFTAFLKRQRSAEALADALAANNPSARAADVGLRVMNSNGRRDENLVRVLAPAVTANSQMTAKDITAFVNEIRTKGNAQRGGEIFRRPTLGCITCHAVNGQGGNIGPNLSAVGTAQPIDFIVGAILDPQKEIKEGYISIAVTMKDGEEYQGYQVRETKDELVMRDILQNREVHLRRAAIQDKRQNGSVMPSGLADVLTRDEFRDLVRYLSDLGRPR
jgi:putative heme-binding domain-containing protein